jgi:hypothetical protein
MKAIGTALITLTLAFAALPALADHGHGGVWKRIDRQENRIARGVERGDLTRHEARKLYRQHRETERLAYDFTRDGRLSKRERRILDHRLDDTSACIHDLRHNGRYAHADRYRDDHRRGKKERVYWVDDGYRHGHRYDLW